MPIKDELISMGFPSSRVDGAIRAKGKTLRLASSTLSHDLRWLMRGPSHLEKELMAMGFERSGSVRQFGRKVRNSRRHFSG